MRLLIVPVLLVIEKISISYGGTANVAVQIAKFSEKAKFVGKVRNDSKIFFILLSNNF